MIDKEIKRRWRIKVGVTSVEGCQWWEVEAETEEEAKTIFDRGDAKFVAEEVNVTDVGEPAIEEIK